MEILPVARGAESRGSLPTRTESGPDVFGSDSFRASGADERGLTYGPAFPSARSQADREADAALLHACGEGCGCASSVGAADDPLDALEARDREVREHEQQHYVTAGDAAVSGPQFTFVTSKSGRQFAVGGKVHVDVSEIAGDPRKTLEKMERIQRAALAPSCPSSQDRRVASEAASKAMTAQAQIRAQDAK